MKSLIFLAVLFCLVVDMAIAQVDQNIPTPNDLQLEGVEILTKTKLPDGTVEIRYKARNGNTYRRTISPPKEGEVQIVKEWTEGFKGQIGFDPGKILARAKGTGQTTGNIANVELTNKNTMPVDVLPQALFIPSDGKYQSYVGRIPDGITVPPGQTTTVPVTGYCTDVHKPPVPSGTEMPPFENWVPVHDPNDIIDGDDYPIVATPPVSTFVPEDIEDIINTPGFIPVPPDAAPDMIITWPGTDIPVGGTLDPDDDPTVFAPVIVKVMDEVEAAAASVTESGVLTTPFSADPPRQIESTIQQIVWIYASVITGDAYKKLDFAERVYDQYEEKAGKAVTTLPDDQKEKMDSGIDEFWAFFTAVGVEAKVISNQGSHSTSSTGNTDLIQSSTSDTDTPEEEKDCLCDTIGFTLKVSHVFENVEIVDFNEPVTLTNETNSKSIPINNKSNKQKVRIELSNVVVECNCSVGGQPCSVYAKKSFDHKTNKESQSGPDNALVRIKNDQNCKITNKPSASPGTSFDMEIEAVPPKGDKDEKGVKFTITLSAMCTSEDCRPKYSSKCVKKLEITL